MPFKVVPLSSKGKYKVINAVTGRIHMKSGTLKDAKAQIRIMEQADKGKGRK